MKKLLILFGLLIGLGLSAACSQPEEPNDHLKVGTISGPESDLMKVAQEQALKKYGLHIEIVEFTDYTMPNLALNDGSIDANMFQHQPYLDAVVQSRGYPLVSAGKVFVYPMALYSKKFHSLADIPNKATVAIPNDPSNEGRALLLLQQANLIQLHDQHTTFATVKDIASNPKQLVFKEMNAAQLPRVLKDVDLAALNTNYAIVSGLNPQQNGLISEDHSSPYANIVAVKKDRLQDPRISQLLDALHSEPVRDAAKKLFQDQAIPAWQNQ